MEETIDFGLKEQESEEPQYLEEGKIDNPFFVYGRLGEPCRVCGAAIKSFGQGGRSTFFCPGCQPKVQAKRPAKRRVRAKRGRR